LELIALLKKGESIAYELLANLDKLYTSTSDRFTVHSKVEKCRHV